MPHAHPPAIVRAAADRTTQIKQLNAALVAGDRDNQRKARRLGELLDEEREECIKAQRPWLKRLAELGVQPRTAGDCRAISKGYREGILSESDSDLGYSRALNKARVALRRAKAAKEAAANDGGEGEGEGEDGVPAAAAPNAESGQRSRHAAGTARKGATPRPSADHTREYRIPFKRKDYPVFADLVRLAMKRSGKDRPGVMMDAVESYVKELSNG
jgi:hypothetical protein